MKQILRATFSFAKAGFKPLPVTVAVIVVLLISPLFVGQRGMGMAGLLLGTAIGVWTSIAVHELGHLVLGKLVDFRFVLYVASPLAVLRTAKGIRISGNESWLLPGIDGDDARACAFIAPALSLDDGGGTAGQPAGVHADRQFVCDYRLRS